MVKDLFSLVQKLLILEDHSVIALLGESPGASTSVSVALEVLEKNFPEYESEWTPKIQK